MVKVLTIRHDFVNKELYNKHIQSKNFAFLDFNLKNPSFRQVLRRKPCWMQYEYTEYSPQGLEMLELVILMMRVRQGYKMELLKLEHILQ